MNHSIRLMLGFTLSFVATISWAGAASSPQSQPVPAATFAQFECAGFISPHSVPGTIRVFNGADNDLYEILHNFSEGDYVYLRRTDRQPFRVGEAYSIVRPENGFWLDPSWVAGKLENQILPPSSRYRRQRYEIESLGYPYDNTGLVRVVKVTPQGAIAKVLFTCNGINPQDIAVPYQPEPIPNYVPTADLNRFALPNGRLTGTIVAASHATAYLAEGSIAFLNIGQNQGVVPGQKYRIYAISRDNVTMGLEGVIPMPPTPRETLGELVILRVQEKSSVGIVVKNLREIAVGDGVELE